MIPLTISTILVVIAVMWFISTQRILVMLDKNINNAMSQIGVQLSKQWDALSVLLDLTKGYTQHECGIISDTIKERRSIIAKSSAKDAAEQDNMLLGAMSHIMAVGEQYPEIKKNQQYSKTINCMNQYKGMVHQSILIYNDSVTKLNRHIRMFPVSLIAGILGFDKRSYLEQDNE